MVLIVSMIVGCDRNAEPRESETTRMDTVAGAGETGCEPIEAAAPEQVDVICTEEDQAVELGLTPGKAPPRIAMWAHTDPERRWYDLGKQPEWLLLTELTVDGTGAVRLPCEYGYYYDPAPEDDPDGDGAAPGFVYPEFTIYIWPNG